MSTNGVNGNASSDVLPALALNADDFLKHEYDFVIVGGGTAGLAVAARLTENPDVTVGVLEAGKNRLDDFLVDTPGVFTQLLGNDEYDWKFMSVPQINGKEYHIPRGKLLGGSSGINYMMYVRGSTQDYDDWAILADDPSWGSDKMNQYMRKHQTLDPVDEAVVHRLAIPYVDNNHGTSGPVHTSFNDFFLPIEDDFQKAFDEVTGIDKKPVDPWSGDHIGIFNTLGTVARAGPNKGKRSYAARGYFATNAQRPNLHVLCEASVTSVKLEGDKAVGVNFKHQSKAHTVNVKREVVVSCGAIQTPQILELSGIGDPEVLKAAGVECKIENKGVGNNLQDHSLALVTWELTPGNPTLEVIYDPDVMEGAMKQLTEAQGGPLTSISSTQGFFPYKLFASDEEQASILKLVEDSLSEATSFQKKQYERTVAHLKDDKSANLQLVFIAHNLGVEGFGDQSKLFPPLEPGKPMTITAALCLQYPLSRGSVHIKTADVNDHPALDPAMLKHPADEAVIAIGLRLFEKITHSKAMEGKIAKRSYPAEAESDFSDTAQAQAHVRDSVFSEYHPVGSCAVGDAVDAKLRVKGVRNLRVADASVFPNHVSGNCIASVYAVAEKAADLIKEDWEYAALKKAGDAQ